ncbi:MAG: YciI family protein [Actinomycetota bacterium]|nr:YciI family protein [Actinomycetota bacterium]
MRFMMLVKASEDSEAGALPSEGQLAEMGRYNDELVKAGVLLAADGLQASVKGARVVFSGGQTTVTDGPFTETKELIAGYWVIQVRSKDEALEWARRVPFQDGEIEIRQVFEAEDFGDALTPELREQEERQRAEMTAKR